MIQNLRKRYYNFYEVYLNREIRGFALEVLTTKKLTYLLLLPKWLHDIILRTNCCLN